MESKKFLTTDEVATEFGLDAASLKKFVDAGEIRALADRGTWKYRRDELQALLDAGKIQSPATDPALETLSEDDEELFFPKPSDTVNYMELDEEALADQASTFEAPNPNAVESLGDDADWFVPSEAAEMAVPPEQSSSDVSIYSEPAGDAEPAEAVPREQSSSDVMIYSGPSDATAPSIASGSDSDVRIASEYETPKPEDSGILLDFNMDAGATVSSSGSSLRLPQTVPGEIQASGGSDENEDLAWDDASPAAETGDSSVVGISAGGSSIGLGSISDDDGSSLGLGGDSAVQLHDVTGSRVKPRMEESGILLDDGSQVGITGGSSILAGPAGMTADSGITVAYVNEDSGITLNSVKEDSGITLENNRGMDDDDSGISLSAGDSGISLSAGDSGLSLEGADSGIMMESMGDSGISVDGNARTMADGELAALDDGDRTQTLDLAGHFDDDSTFDLNLDDGANATSELLLGDDDEADETSATVIRKGRPQPGSLSAAFELDDAAEVEDLEISQDLDAGVDEEIEELSDDEEVFDASEETFGSEEVEATEDEDYLEPAAKAKATGPREPAWGVDMTIGLVACSLFLAANSLILWGGVSTMWTGADADGPAASLIQTFGELIK